MAKRAKALPASGEVSPGYSLGEDGRTIDYTGPTSGAHYCGHGWSYLDGNRPDLYGSGERWAVWSLEPTDATCADCGEGFGPGATAVKLVHGRDYSAQGAVAAAARSAVVHHVGCVDWRTFAVPHDLKAKRTRVRGAIERAGIPGLLDSPCRVTLCEHWSLDVTQPTPRSAERVKRELGMTLDQLALFFPAASAAA